MNIEMNVSRILQELRAINEETEKLEINKPSSIEYTVRNFKNELQEQLNLVSSWTRKFNNIKRSLELENKFNERRNKRKRVESDKKQKLTFSETTFRKGR